MLDNMADRAELYNIVKNESYKIVELIKQNENEKKAAHILAKLFPSNAINSILLYSGNNIIFGLQNYYHTSKYLVTT